MSTACPPRCRGRARLGPRPHRRRLRPRPRRPRRLPPPLAPHRPDGDGLQPGREPVGLRHRQGQRDPQLPPRHRPHRPARHAGPFSVTGQPNAMGGREVGGLANMLAAHLELENPAHRAAVQRLLALPDHRRASGPEGGRHVPRRRRRPDQGALDPGDQPRRQHARGRRRRRRARRLPVRRRLRRDRAHRHRPARRRAAPARPAGARSPAPSRTPSAASPASAPSCRAPGEARPDWWALAQVGQRLGWPRGLRLVRAGRDLPRARRALRLRRRARPRLRHRRPRRPRRRRLRGDGPGALAGRRTRPVLRRRRLLHAPTAAPACSRSSRPSPSAPARCASTPAASATSGTR